MKDFNGQMNFTSQAGRFSPYYFYFYYFAPVRPQAQGG